MIKLLCTLLLVTATSTAMAAPKKKTPKKNGPTASAPAQPASSGITIKSIEVAGNRKIEKDAILTKIASKAGAEYSAATVRADVEALFKLGFFNNIEVDRQVTGKEAVLTYKVLEKPSITEITYEGNSEIKSEDIADATGIKAYQLLNMSKVKEAVEKVQKLYEDKGFFLARVEAEVQNITQDETVRLVFKIRENDKVKVRKVTFLGAKNLTEAELKSKMITQEGGFFSAMSGSGQYKQEAFDRDVQIIRFMYYNQGYVQAKVDRPQVTVTPDKKNIYITFHVEEGEQYSVGDVDFAGDLLFPKAELFEAIKIDKNGVFSYEVLQKDISELTAKYGDLGYAFANVIPRTRANDKERKMDLVFEFDKGSKVYFGKINVVGNSKTRDKVVRRELKVHEGELYNETRRRQSLENIQRLGFFEDVNFKTSVDPEKTDVMNVDIAVKERNTGQIQLGAGYGTSQGFTLQGSVQQSNFLGRGQNLGANVNLSGTGSYYSLSFTEPYFNDTEWSLGGDLYRSQNTGRVDYDEAHTGMSLRMGHPIAEFTRGFLRAKYDKSELTERKDSTGKVITDEDLFPLATASGETISLTGTLEYDTRNDRFSPTKGIFASASYEYAGFGQLKYNRASTRFNYFKNIFWDVVWRNDLQYARIDGIDGQDVPFNELYLLGGPYSLRGFRSYRVGKMKRSQKIYNDLTNPAVTNPPLSAEQAEIQAMRFYGGTQQAMARTELQFPLVKDAGIMGAGFFDVGAADDVLTSDSWFADVGFGLRWYSPIGVLRFEWGFPLNRDPNYHDASVFEFSIGPSF
ncbi:outer membrane protein assembly factor BamA [Bdellovibrio sp. KM01]|uniref:outer membrane protein assembly factor BamA n=1 Tax=Bdellovibrio sp. KM01 TaxID=2748865 RepID=UPI00210297DF|nr:outer membrane protein assembly factor BamA [Bdellovibrio sp. KM01]